MKHVFDMRINPYTGTAEVLLNGKMLSSQSQLRICSIQHLSDWYRDLPDLLYSELNDEYLLRVQCLEIEYIMLKAVFSERSECLDIVHTAILRKYDAETRCRWLTEVSDSLGIKIPEIPGFSIIATADAAGYKASILNTLDSFTRSYCTDKKEQVNVIVTRQGSLSEAKSYIASENDIIFAVDETSAGTVAELGLCLMISTKKQSMISLIRQWIEITIFYPYMMFGRSQLDNSGQATTFYTRARLQMLSREEPVVYSKMPSRLECGLTAPIALEVFPTSSLTVKSNDPSVVSVQNGEIKALSPGPAELQILSESGKTVCVHAITAYFVPRVTSVILSVVNGNKVLEGAQFTVNAIYNPANAVNISNASWSFFPADSLTDIGAGRFEALKAGTCTITLKVDGVSESVVVQILPLAKRLKMAPEMRVKVNAGPALFHAELEPAGSACENIVFSIADTSVAQWNPVTKSIVPINEGVTSLEVSAVDAKGSTVFVQSCQITILPEKDIITPPTLPTIIIVCAILSLITVTTVMSPLIAGCGGIAAIIVIGKNLVPLLKKRATRANIIEFVLGIAGVIGCAFAIAFYLGLI